MLRVVYLPSTVFPVKTQAPLEQRDDLERQVQARFKSRIGMTPDVKAVDYGGLPRSEKKTRRVIDRRN